jgi:hypothetical protein
MKHTLKYLQNEQDVAPQEFSNWKYVSGFSSQKFCTKKISNRVSTWFINVVKIALKGK